MLRHSATLCVLLLAALPAGAGKVWAQQLPLRDSFAETPSSAKAVQPSGADRYSPQGGLNRAPMPENPAITSAQPRANSLPQEPEEVASIQNSHGPTGIGVGGFDIFPSLEIRGGFQEVSSQGNGYGAFLGEVTGQGGIGLFDLDFGLAADIERDEDSFSEVEYAANARARVDINRYLGVQGDVLLEHNPQEGLSFNDDNSLSNLPDETIYGGGLEVSLAGNRASLTPRARAEEHRFSGAANAGDLDYLQSEFGLRAAYEFSPLLTVFTDAEYARADFDNGRGADGILRGSETRSGSVGAVYTPGSWLSAEVSVGVEQADFDDGSDLSGARLDGNLSYALNGLTDFSLRASHGIANDVATAGGVRETRISLGMVHRFRSYLELSTALAYLREDGGADDAARIDLEAQLAYAVRRGVYLTAGGEYSRLTDGANEGDADWQVYMGVRLAR